VETSTFIAIAVAVVAVVTTVLFLLRTRSLSRAVDDARARIGGSPPERPWQQMRALDEALRALERSSSQAQRERSQLAGALQAAGIGIIITDDHGVAVFANHAADQLLGARQGEAIAEEQLREAVEHAVLERTSTATELELFSPVRRVLEVIAIPLDFGVESVGAVAYLEEVTEHRRVDTIRRDFIANVGHELKTPLSALAALAKTIGDSLDDPKVATKLASRLEVEASRLSNLVEGLLNLSQAEALASHAEPVSAEALIRSVESVVEEAATSSGVELMVEATPPAARVSGDQRQLRSMLVNLVDNAIKYSEPSKDEPTATVTIRSRIDGDDVVFEVIDQGVGIPEDQHDRVFERFYKVDRVRSRATGGSGLGLSIARHVATNHGGTITVVSAPEEGSTFSVKLPLWKGS
jgi:two-component system sensor histidine kinase SenX3